MKLHVNSPSNTSWIKWMSINYFVWFGLVAITQCCNYQFVFDQPPNLQVITRLSTLRCISKLSLSLDNSFLQRSNPDWLEGSSSGGDYLKLKLTEFQELSLVGCFSQKFAMTCINEFAITNIIYEFELTLPVGCGCDEWWVE